MLLSMAPVRQIRDQLWKRLADAAHWLGLDRQDALQSLTHTAQHIAQHWEPLLRTAAATVVEDAT